MNILITGASGFIGSFIVERALAIPDTNHLFATVDQAIFGSQPTLRFSQMS